MAGMVLLLLGILALAVGLVAYVTEIGPGLVPLLFIGMVLLAMGMLTLILDVVSTWADSVRRSLR